MGVLLRGRYDNAANIRRCEVLIAVRDARTTADALNAILVTEPDALYEDGNILTSEQRRLFTDQQCLCNFITVTCGRIRLLFCSGVRNAFCGQLLWQGYTGPWLGSQNPNQGNLRNTTLESFTGLNPFYVGEPLMEREIWCGHSAGGTALFYWLEEQYLITPPRQQPECLALGMPKIGAGEPLRRTTSQNWVHIWNADDPVVFIPPRVGEWEGIWAGLSASQRVKINQFQRLRTGYTMNQDGALTPQGSVAASNDAPASDIGAWLDATNRGRQTPHSLEEYLRRFRQAFLSEILAYSPDTGPGYMGGADLPVFESPREVPASADRVRQYGAQAQEFIIINSPRGLTEASVVIPPQRAFKAVRAGRIWYVEFSGTRIATAPNKKRAQGFARVGNDFLRRMQIESNVDPVALVSTLQQYCQDASAADGPFIPPLRVN